MRSRLFPHRLQRAASLFRTFICRLATAFLLTSFVVGQPTVGQDLEASGEPEVLQWFPQWKHLRATGEREWSTFSAEPDSEFIAVDFDSKANSSEWTVSIRQQDVKESWTVSLNDQAIGKLIRDENDLIHDFLIPVGRIRSGANRLTIRQTGKPAADDIRVGQIAIRPVAPSALRGSASVRIEINDDQLRPMPGRVTLVDGQGTLIPFATAASAELAVRDGVAYTSSGIVELTVAAGDYRVYAGRGFEYATESSTFSVKDGEQVKRTFALDREVDTRGWVCCDTHIHTVTHSGHGDATIGERMVTLVGEGIELPIATDHNKHIDYAPLVSKLGLGNYFTPVIGNEVTTGKGHFNIFPVRPGATIPDHRRDDWSALFDEIFAVPGVRVAILNHGRDLHGGFRPLSPRHHVSVSGENLDDRVLRANAMELINSGAVQTDSAQLFGDWCGMLNRGMSVTPVGCSDSHDVSRYIVGQGRTYIRCDDADVGNIDVGSAVDAFLRGSVSVSYGLFATVMVDGDFGPGSLARLDPDQNRITIDASVASPGWVSPESLELYVNGSRHRSHAIIAAAEPISENTNQDSADAGRATSGRRHTVRWQIPRDLFDGDVWVCVVARGEGDTGPYWPLAKPYQPDSIDFKPATFSLTGPVRIDIDGDGEFQSPFKQAERIVVESAGDLPRLLAALTDADPAVTTQVASIILRDDDTEEAFWSAAEEASASVQTRLAAYRRAIQASVVARLERAE